MPEEKALPQHTANDIPVYLTVVIILGTIGIVAIGGVITLAILGKSIPDSIIALGSTSVGALTGLLAPVPRGK